MTTVGIGVFITDDLYYYGKNEYSDGWRARDRAATCIEGEVNRSQHTPDVYLSEDRPDPNRESTNESWSRACPCFTKYTCDFNNVLDYFTQWVYNCDIYVKSDANVLITNTSNLNGGLAHGGTDANKGFAQTGQSVCDLPASYERWGDNDAHNAMHTVFEEVGHNLMKGSDDADEDEDGAGIYQHDAGAILEHEGDGSTDPAGTTGMGINNNETEFTQNEVNNDCNNTYNTDGNIYWEMKWSDCCESYWGV